MKNFGNFNFYMRYINLVFTQSGEHSSYADHLALWLTQ